MQVLLTSRVIRTMKQLTNYLLCLLASISLYLDISLAQAEPGASSSTKSDKPTNHESDGETRPRGRLGFKLGASRSEFVGRDVTSDFAEYSEKLYWTAGLSASLRLYGALSFQADFLSVSKGRETELDGELFSTLHVSYLEIPLLLRLDSDWRPVSPYLLAGPALGVLWKFENEVESDGSVMDLKDQADSLDWSGVVGLGIEVYGFSLEGRWNEGLTSFLKEEVNQDARHRVLAVMLGYQYSFHPASPPPPDSDRDGVPDKADGCILEPEDLDMFEDENGCPEPDNDRDGILDEVEECDNEPEDLDKFEDEDGCPDSDNDRDGILDEADECDNEPEDLDKFEDEDGCPESDNDRDGILDLAEECDNEPEDEDKFEDEDGCPEPDNDRDGILDLADQCDDKPEDKDRFEDEDGCPEPNNDGDRFLDSNDSCPKTRGQGPKGCRLVKFRGKEPVLNKLPNFPTDLSIPKKYRPYLDEVADLLTAGTETRQLRITVNGQIRNATEQTIREQNLAKAKEIAETVKAYLVQKGVPPERLQVEEGVVKNGGNRKGIFHVELQSAP